MPAWGRGSKLWGDMHYLAPFPIMFGVVGVICGLLWLVAAGSEGDGGPEPGLFYIFGMSYIVLRVIKELVNEPMNVLPGMGILVGGAGLIWLGVVMW